jgi:putative transposase
VVGVDLSIKTLATLSTGEAIPGPKAHTAALARLRRANKSLSRKVRLSSNWRKAKARLTKVHARVANVRRDAHHKLTHRLVHEFDTIGVEDLDVLGMLKTGYLARRVSDAAFSEFRRVLEYKAKWYGATVVVADRGYASSAICSACGTVKENIPLSRRVWTCGCGATHQRDLNAAKNLEKVAASFAVSACGERGSGAARKPRVKLRSVKQEGKEVLSKDAA